MSGKQGVTMKRNEEIIEFHKILSDEFPKFLKPYIQTPEMQRIDKISISCGTDYCGIYNPPYFYSNLDHSIGVALIIWNFTKDKAATLAGLFHDISTPVFKHCIDFMNNDHENQESTEERTEQFIKKSPQICSLLEKDGINIDQVVDYKNYPIADNETPKLSADRLEYNFSSGLSFKRVWTLEKIKKIYADLIIIKNEDGIDELAFKSTLICEECIKTISKLWPAWVDTNDRTTMQFLADIINDMIVHKYICIDELYTLSEEQIIEKIKFKSNESIANNFLEFEKVKEAKSSDFKIEGKYCINVKSKTRYINPLVINGQRIYDISNKSKKLIDGYILFKKEGWTYFDFKYQE